MKLSAGKRKIYLKDIMHVQTIYNYWHTWKNSGKKLRRRRSPKTTEKMNSSKSNYQQRRAIQTTNSLSDNSYLRIHPTNLIPRVKEIRKHPFSTVSSSDSHKKSIYQILTWRRKYIRINLYIILGNLLLKQIERYWVRLEKREAKK